MCLTLCKIDRKKSGFTRESSRSSHKSATTLLTMNSDHSDAEKEYVSDNECEYGGWDLFDWRFDEEDDYRFDIGEELDDEYWKNLVAKLDSALPDDGTVEVLGDIDELSTVREEKTAEELDHELDRIRVRNHIMREKERKSDQSVDCVTEPTEEEIDAELRRQNNIFIIYQQCCEIGNFKDFNDYTKLVSPL